MYFPRKVATLDEKKGTVEKNYLHYDDLLKNSTNKDGECFETCCYTCALCMSTEECFAFQVSNMSDMQAFATSPAPAPSSEVIKIL